jgi:hypothetical protein
MSVKFNYCVLVCFLIALSIGCGSNCKVTGKVTFPDGTPLTVGEVVFETSALASRGKIQKDGSYTISTGELKGVPKGTYQVSISGFTPTVTPAPLNEEGRPTGRPQVVMPEIPFDKKFLSPTTSGLTCEVKGRTKYDITVEPPK